MNVACYLIYQFLNLGIYSAVVNHLSRFIDVLITRVYIDLNLSNILSRDISITLGCLHYLRNTDNYCKSSCIFDGINGSRPWLPIRKLFVLAYIITSLDILTDVTKTLNKWGFSPLHYCDERCRQLLDVKNSYFLN